MSELLRLFKTYQSSNPDTIIISNLFDNKPKKELDIMVNEYMGDDLTSNLPHSMRGHELD